MKKITGFLCCLALSGILFYPVSSKAQTISTLRPREILQQVADNKGKVVLLNFFASWCDPCKREIPGLISIRDDINEDDLVIIGISVDDNQTAMMSYIRSIDFNYPVFHASEEVLYLFRIDAIPFNVIYNREGSITYADSGLLLESWLREILKRVI